MGDTTIHAPGARDRFISILVTMLTAGFLYIVVGFVLSGVVLLLFAQGSNVSGRITDPSFARAVAANAPGWVAPTLLYLPLVAAAVGAGRFGLGTVGDAVGSMKAVDASGARAAAWRTYVRTGLPMVVVGLGFAGGVLMSSIIIVLGASIVALFRDDRRGLWELASGIHLDSTVAVKTTREQRLAEAEASRRPRPTEEPQA